MGKLERFSFDVQYTFTLETVFPCISLFGFSTSFLVGHLRVTAYKVRRAGGGDNQRLQQIRRREYERDEKNCFSL
jgi:hypothetical protein